MSGTGGTGGPDRTAFRVLICGTVLVAAGLCLAGQGGRAAAVAARPAGGATGGRGGTSTLAAGGATVRRGGTSMLAAATVAATAPATTTATASATPTAADAVTAAGSVREGACTGPAARKSLAKRLSADIKAALADRYGDRSVTVYDRVTGVNCVVNGGEQYDSASVVKAIILAALLHWHQETRTPLSDDEKYLATLMITQSDNAAATALWNELGVDGLQHFLNLAKMRETVLNTYGAWGLTQVTAHDEMLLLRLLTGPNPVLTTASRNYQLNLMARVIAWQRWGTTAGAPRGVTAGVKNGWLPLSDGWHVNSLGAFTGHGRNYMIVVLTDGDPAEQYGIDTIEGVARLVHRDLNAVLQAAAAARLAATEGPVPSPFAVVPALPTPPS